MPYTEGRKGFTLVETMVGSSLLVSIGLVAMLWLDGTVNLWWTTNTQSDVRVTAQQVMNRMLAELRSATRTGTGSPPNAAIPAAPGNTTMTFYLPTDMDGSGTIVDALGNTEWDTANAVGYVYVPAQRQLARIRGAATTVLANDVQAVTFEDRTIDTALNQREVRIRLTVQKTTPRGQIVSATAVEIVKLRN